MGTEKGEVSDGKEIGILFLCFLLVCFWVYVSSMAMLISDCVCAFFFGLIYYVCLLRFFWMVCSLLVLGERLAGRFET